MNKEPQLNRDELKRKIEQLELILYVTKASPKLNDWLADPLQYWPKSWKLIPEFQYIIKSAFFLYRNRLLRNELIDHHFNNEENANEYYTQLLQKDLEVNGEKVDENEFQMMVDEIKKMVHYFQYKWRSEI